MKGIDERVERMIYKKYKSVGRNRQMETGLIVDDASNPCSLGDTFIYEKGRSAMGNGNEIVQSVSILQFMQHCY